MAHYGELHGELQSAQQQAEDHAAGPPPGTSRTAADPVTVPTTR
jgi:hypothetical protein